jgi:hypothetical protein
VPADDHLDDVTAELVAREPIFHKPELGTTRAMSIGSSNVRCRRLGSNAYAPTYRLHQAGRLTRRPTLRRRDPDGWKVLYHEGPIIRGPQLAASSR